MLAGLVDNAMKMTGYGANQFLHEPAGEAIAGCHLERLPGPRAVVDQFIELCGGSGQEEEQRSKHR